MNHRKTTGCPICRRKSSRLEEFVEAFLIEQYPELHLTRRVRAIPAPTGAKWEIDIFLPKLKLGFEVQDFATHSRSLDDEEATFFGRPIIRKGPTYHELKRRLAKEHLRVELIDIWEDELLDGSFKQTVSTAIAHAGSRSGEPML